MPDGIAGSGAGNALVLNAEDGPQDTIRPRLEALGADLGRLFVLRPSSDLGSPLRLPDIPIGAGRRRRGVTGPATS